MHETSPGAVKKRELSIRSDNKSELSCANSKIDMALKNDNTDDDDELEMRIYDDPCDLMDDVPIFRMAKSRSWFCCPSSEAFCNQQQAITTAGQPNNIFYNRGPDYSLVTEAPRIQFHTVCRLVKSQKKIQFSFSFLPECGAKLDL